MTRRIRAAVVVTVSTLSLLAVPAASASTHAATPVAATPVAATPLSGVCLLNGNICLGAIRI